MSTDFSHFGAPTYCESRSPLAIRNLLGAGSITEIGCTISSLAMTLFGTIGLFYTNKNQEVLSRLLYSILFINGIGSAIYHFSDLSWIGSLDGIPMLIMCSFGATGIMDEIIHEKAPERTKNQWKSASALLSMCYLMAALMAEQYGKGTIAFRVIFATPMISTAFLMIYLYVKVHDFIDRGVSAKQVLLLKNVFIRAWCTGISAFIMWLLDLFVCVQSKYFFVFGHWVWHINIGYFGVCLICIINFLRGNNNGMSPVVAYIWGNTIPISYYRTEPNTPNIPVRSPNNNLLVGGGYLSPHPETASITDQNSTVSYYQTTTLSTLTRSTLRSPSTSSLSS